VKLLRISLLLCIGTHAAAQEYRLSFDGSWFVMQGGDTPNVNPHTLEELRRAVPDLRKEHGLPPSRGYRRAASTVERPLLATK